MKFNPKNFRTITSDTNPPLIRTADESTLILIKESGDAEYARTRTDKDRLVEQFDEKQDLLLWAWVGAYHTDVFQLTKEDLQRYYR